MSVVVPTASAVSSPARGCRPADKITRSLLGYGMIAGPFYVGVSLVEAMLKPGFDLRRHSWSLLANGPYGWVHSATLVLTGLMVIAAAAGFRRALQVRAVPVLLGIYGAGMGGAGIFTADPADGFPVGVPVGPGTMTWPGVLHLASGGLGFLAFSAAAVAVGVGRLRCSDPGRGVFAVATGVLFLAAFVGLASGATGPTVLVFAGTVVLAWTWLLVTSLDLYRRLA